MTTEYERAIRYAYVRGAAWARENHDSPEFTEKAAADYADALLPPASTGAGGDLDGPTRSLWNVYHAACHLQRDADSEAACRAWLDDMLAAFEVQFPQWTHGVYFQPVPPMPPLDTAATPSPPGCPIPGAGVDAVAEARAAVVKTAMHWWSVSGTGLQAAWAMGDCGEACKRLIEAEALAADAQKGG